jgi:hypothetical protein
MKVGWLAVPLSSKIKLNYWVVKGVLLSEKPRAAGLLTQQNPSINS